MVAERAVVDARPRVVRPVTLSVEPSVTAPVTPNVPATPKRYADDVVPTPTFPFARTFIICEVVPTEKRFVVPVAVEEATDNTEVGVEVPIPTFPVESICNLSIPAVENPSSFAFARYIPVSESDDHE